MAKGSASRVAQALMGAGSRAGQSEFTVDPKARILRSALTTKDADPPFCRKSKLAFDAGKD